MANIVAFLELVEAHAMHFWLLDLAILSCSTYLFWVYRKMYINTSHRRLSAENARGSGTGVPLMMTLQNNSCTNQIVSSTSSTPDIACELDAQGSANSTSTSRLRHILPTGQDVSRIFSQQGYKKSSLGTVFQMLWLAVPILSQAHLALIAIDRHLFRGSEVAGGTFTFLLSFTISHCMLAAMCALPTSFRAFFMLPCPLREADHVLIKEDDEEHSIPEARMSLSGILAFLRGEERDQKTSLVPVIRQDAHYFEYTGVRFLWSSNADRFRPVGTVFASGAGAWRVLQGGGAATSVVNDLRRTIGPNIANVNVPSLTSSLLSEFGDFLYVFQLACFWLFHVYAEWNLALIWLTFIGCLGLYRSLFFLRIAHLQVSNIAREFASKKETVLRSGKWVKVHAHDLVLGDLVQITESCVSADLALISGCVGVNEGALTGDAAPVQKTAVDRNGTWELDVHVHGKKHMLFCGTQVIRCIGDESVEGLDCAIGLVVGIGGRTMHSQIVRMLCLPSQLKFKYHDDLPKVFLVMSLFAFSCLIFALNTSKDTMLSTTILGLQGLALLLHPLMPAALNFGQVISARRLARQNIGCLCLGRMPVAGKLSTLVLDKTGTITHEGLFLVSVRPVSSDGSIRREIPAQRLKTDLRDELLQLAMLGLACRARDESTASGETSGGAGFDEQIASALGVSRATGSNELKPLRWLEFDAERNTSGAILRCSQLKKTLLVLKGSPERLLQLSAPDVELDGLRECIEIHAKDDGFYVLGVAWREIPEAEVPNINDALRDDLEKDLRVSGLLLFRNEIKSDSAAAIDELVLGGVCCVMCTGDSVMTGVNVARRCGILSAGAHVLIGDEVNGEVRWRNLDGVICSKSGIQFHSSTELALTVGAFRTILEHGGSAAIEAMLPQVKVFGRMKPDDKIQVIRLWQKFRGKGLITGMVGDGGNDCGALRAAHVGIALGQTCAAAVASFHSTHGMKTGGFVSLFTVVDVLREGRACLDSNLAMYMLFATYSGILALGSVTMRMWLGYERFVFSEWQLLALDVLIGIVVVCSIACGQAPKHLAHERPTWNLLGPRSVLTVALVVSAHCCATLIVITDLLYGSGRAFVEIVQLQFLEIPRGAKGAQGDNHVSAILFIQTLVTLSSAAIVFSRANDFREELCKNLRLLSISWFVLSMAGVLLWAPPNAVGCLFRVGCDNPTSRSLSLRFPLLQSLSTWGIGGCFFSPHLVSCRTNSSLQLTNGGVCWVAPPRDAHLPLSWVDGPEERRPAPFWTVEDKQRFCAGYPYKASRIFGEWHYASPARDWEERVYKISYENAEYRFEQNDAGAEGVLRRSGGWWQGDVKVGMIRLHLNGDGTLTSQFKGVSERDWGRPIIAHKASQMVGEWHYVLNGGKFMYKISYHAFLKGAADFDAYRFEEEDKGAEGILRRNAGWWQGSVGVGVIRLQLNDDGTIKSQFRADVASASTVMEWEDPIIAHKAVTADNSLGNIWCFYPDLQVNNCEPDPPRLMEKDKVTGCMGPNNCFSSLFKTRATVVLVLFVVALECLYPALSSWGRRVMPPSLARTTFRQFEAARDIEMAEFIPEQKATARA